jgi:hypothetical protein
MMAAMPTQMKASNRRWLIPLAAFVLVFVLHAFYVRHTARLPVRGWAPETVIVDEGLWGFGPYIQARDYFTGYSYALPLAFAAIALRRYRECRQRRICTARNVAIGSVTWSGFLAASGCFLLGCCGSPMLGIYLSLFGPSFLPAVKPLIAGVTTVLVAFSYYWWIWRRNRDEESYSKTSDCTRGQECNCNPVTDAPITR